MDWTPPLTFEERLKAALVPPRLYIWNRHRRELRKGERELHLVPTLADRGRVSLDVGANRGVYAYAMLPHSESVHAFEPNPKMFDVLRRWGQGRLHLHPMALGDATGEAELLLPHSARGYSNQRATLRRFHMTEDYARITIRAARLDDLGIENVGFIKIDVEGFEMQVLAGAADTLARDRPKLLIELEEIHAGRPLAALIDEVRGYGYRAFGLVDGALVPFAELDPARHFRRGERDYLFNFVFLPD
jgi:FkbM family methyltransferase